MAVDQPVDCGVISEHNAYSATNIPTRAGVSSASSSNVSKPMLPAKNRDFHWLIDWKQYNMEDSSKTITRLKTAFVQEQVNFLSQPLIIPDEFREKTELGDKVLDHVLEECTSASSRGRSLLDM